MRICAAADVHYPRQGHDWSAALARTMCESGADVIILAGDICAGDVRAFRKFLPLFDGFPGPRLFVPGNHELWSTARHPNTHRRYAETLRRVVQDLGFHYLPDAPLVVGEVGFVGAVGWYDYAFRQEKPPRRGLRVTPMRAARTDKGITLLPVSGRTDLRWQDLDEADYAARGLVWRDETGPKQAVWNDALYVHWRTEDALVAREQAAGVIRDAGQLPPGVRRLVGVSHFLPWESVLGPPARDVAAAWCRAYMGSPALGEAFTADPRFRLVLCGHAHRQTVVEQDGIAVVNCSVGDGHTGPLLVTLQGDRVETG